MTTACQRVLGTTELLEGIICSLDMRTIIVSAQAVNHRWKDLITESPAIQQHLYLLPAPNGGGGPENPDLNPLLAKSFPLWFVSAARHDYKGLRGTPLVTRSDDFMRRDATWRGMLVSQPPVRKLAIYSKVFGMNHAFEVREYAEGLRMGEFYDHAQLELFKGSSAYFVVYWRPNTTNPYDYRPNAGVPSGVSADDFDVILGVHRPM